MQQALVTGGSGFLGRHIVGDLAADGYQVRVLARSGSKARSMLPASVEVVEGDVTNVKSCARAVEGCSTVFHLAAAYREPGIVKRRYYDVHVSGTKHLLEAARASGVERFVHCSTVGVLSHIDNPPADETWPHNPGDVYQETKSHAEKLALDFHREHGLALTVARPTPIYGPGDLRLLKLFKLIADRRFVMLGSGEVLYHMIYVDDLVRGLRALADHPDAVGEVFTIGGPEYCSLNELTAYIADELKVPAPKLRLPAQPFQILGSAVERVCIPLRVKPPIFRRRVDFFTKSRAFSIEKARQQLGFEPFMSLRDGIKETVHWYRQNGYLPPRQSAAVKVAS